MNFKLLFGPTFLLSLALFAATASAAPLDKSANAKIDEAINVHYLSTNFEKAEGLLRGTLKACGDRCSPAVKARAWMYVGIVRGAGFQDMDGAAAAFMEAVTLYPKVELDRDLSTDDLKTLFDETGGSTSAPSSSDEDVEVSLDEGIGGAPGGAMSCTPEVAEVETRRPVPVACETSQPATRALLYYKEFGASKWTQTAMGKSGTRWLAQIPCSATGLQGSLEWYVVATSAKGQPIDSYGSEAAPVEIMLVASTTLPPPAHPGKDAPPRCADLAECPEEMRGTPACPDTGGSGSGGGGSWGDSCRRNSDCGSELVCLSGACESPPSCETDADCSGGVCEAFLCRYDDEGGASTSADGPKNLISIQIGLDLAQVGDEGICNSLSGSGYVCYVDGQTYAVPQFAANGAISQYHHPESLSYDAQQSGVIGSALAPSTVRILATYERLITPNIGIEGQAGTAFGGAPASSIAKLLHLAVRGKYWFSGTGPGLRVYGSLGGGIGQVDAKKSVYVAEFAQDNSIFYQLSCDPVTEPTCVRSVSAYKSLGTSFVTGGLGAFLNLGGHGPNLELNARVLFPESGFVIAPMGGYSFGF